MKLWPTRTKHTAELVADFDAMTTDPVAFKLNGKIHEIKPISTGEFFAYANAYAKLMAMLDEKKLTINPGELIERYFELFYSVCPSITIEDIKNSNNAQVAGLYQLIIDTVTGRTHADQKKTHQRMMAMAEASKDQPLTQ